VKEREINCKDEDKGGTGLSEMSTNCFEKRVQRLTGSEKKEIARKVCAKSLVKWSISIKKKISKGPRTSQKSKLHLGSPLWVKDTMVGKRGR